MPARGARRPRPSAQLRRLQSVGAKVAHELKNPLASIKGLCQLVARTPESERTQERLAVVASEISRMETILNEYLSFSRPLEDLKPEPLDLAALARDVLDVLAGRAEQAGVALALEGAATPVQGDPRRLKEALINLVVERDRGHADRRHASRCACARRRTASRSRSATPAAASPPEDLERLGTSFFTTRPNGTGLGVVLAQGVITQHGGTLTYASTVGKGTTATIIAARPSRPRAPEPAAARRDGRGARVSTVLLVDDEPGVLFTLSEVLTERGHRVRHRALRRRGADQARRGRHRRSPISRCRAWTASS